MNCYSLDFFPPGHSLQTLEMVMRESVVNGLENTQISQLAKSLFWGTFAKYNH